MNTKAGDVATKNPYAKLLDNAGRVISPSIDLDYIDDIDDPHEDAEKTSVPFPFGTHSKRQYGWP